MKTVVISCPKCGGKISADVSFCPKCGFRVGEFLNDIDALMREASRIKSVDPETAFGYFQTAASKGDKIAMFELGNMYHENVCPSFKTLKRPSEWYASYCYAKADENGHEQAIGKLLSIESSIGYENLNDEAKACLDRKREQVQQEIKKRKAELFRESLRESAERRKLEKERRIQEEKLRKEERERHFNEIIERYNTLIESVSEDNVGSQIHQIIGIEDFLNHNPRAKGKITNPNKLEALISLAKKEKKRREKERRQKQKAFDEERKRKENEAFSQFEKQYLNKILYIESGLSCREGKIAALRPISDTKVYADVYFDDKKEKKTFVLPDAINGGFVSFENKWAKKDESGMSYEEKETLKEKEYLLKVIEACSPRIKADYKAPPIGYVYCNPHDEDYNPQETEDDIYTETMRNFWRDTSMSPFFASVETAHDGLFYIGKTGIENLVTDWRDPKCRAYYNHSTAKTELDISLVRDHDIAYQKYKGFFDKLNTKRGDYKESEGLNVSGLNDQYLVKLLEAFREQKETHDIIETIQANQYKIISDTQPENMLVTGCAGSGKTMVLFHRIAYLAFNDKSFNPNDFLIVSPNKLLNDEANELSIKLQLESIKNIDAYALYFDFVRRCISSTNSCFVLKPEYEGTMKNDRAYSFDCLEKIYSSVEDLCLLRKHDFYDIYFKRLQDCFKRVLKVNIKSVGDIEMAVRESRDIRRALSVLQKVPYKNLLSVDENGKGNRDCAFFINLLSKYLDKSHLMLVKRGDNKGKPYKRLANIPAYYAAVHYRKKEVRYSKQSQVNKDVSWNNKSLIYLYDLATLNDMAANFLEYKKGNYEPLAMDIIDYTISLSEELKQANQSDKLFVYAYLLEKLGIANQYKFKKVFVDEYQNYSMAELSFMKSLGLKGSLNLFGDGKQKIESKGVSPDQLKSLGDFNAYELNVNYRNSRQICEFLNREFSMSMTSTGLTGEAVKIETAYPAFIPEKDGGRTALIVKDLAHICFDSKEFNVVDSKDSKIERNVINLLSVDEVKGLEFEKVYVVDEGLTDGERYLAYSRSLNSLVVIREAA